MKSLVHVCGAVESIYSQDDLNHSSKGCRDPIFRKDTKIPTNHFDLMPFYPVFSDHSNPTVSLFGIPACSSGLICRLPIIGY